MKINISHIKKLLKPYYERTAEFFTKCVNALGNNCREYRKVVLSGGRKGTRAIIMLFSVIFFLDYLMFCLHTGKNVFDIFPNIPLLERKSGVFLYIIDPQKKIIQPEERMIPIFESEESLAVYLVGEAVKGSKRNNTSGAVPCEVLVRKVWFNEIKGGRECIVDIEPVIINDKAGFFSGSEQLFKASVEKTIMKSLDNVSRVVFLEKGIAVDRLWTSSAL